MFSIDFVFISNISLFCVRYRCQCILNCCRVHFFLIYSFTSFFNYVPVFLFFSSNSLQYQNIKTFISSEGNTICFILLCSFHYVLPVSKHVISFKFNISGISRLIRYFYNSTILFPQFSSLF